MSLRWRWALGLAVVAAVAIGLITIAAVVSADRQLRGAVDEDLRHRATQLARRSGTLDNTNRFERGRILRGIVDFDAVVQAFDSSGAVLLRIGPEGVAPPVEPVDLEVLNRNGHRLIRGVEVGGTPYRMITAPIELRLRDGGSPLGFQIAIDHSRVEANLAALTRQLVLIGAIGVMLVGFTGWVLASRAVQPITDLTDTAERIASTERLDAAGQLDISAPAEIGRLAGAFSSMLAALSTSRQEQQRLVSDAGHEFRTPITALTTNLELLRRQRDRISGEQRDELIDAALAESNQLADLAAELVDLASDVHQAGEPTTAIDLESLAYGVADRFRHIGWMTIEVSGVGTTVTGRRLQLERALGNLVDNATKWARSTVEIVLQGSTVSVRDDGPGVPEEDLSNIFRRFYRSDEARTTPGSGLGLAIVEHLVRAHGGTVFARNLAGGGAEIGFSLPQDLHS
ncbi:MAG: ATP-binding protein [bacterium]|nr:ATP-binding protein [bacterium]